MDVVDKSVISWAIFDFSYLYHVYINQFGIKFLMTLFIAVHSWRIFNREHDYNLYNIPYGMEVLPFITYARNSI